MLVTGEVPTPWSHPRHFSDREGGNLTHIPTACGAWYNGQNHFVTFYLCADYWSLMNPLMDIPCPHLGCKQTSTGPYDNHSSQKTYQFPPYAIQTATTHSYPIGCPTTKPVMRHHRNVHHIAPPFRKQLATYAPLSVHLHRPYALIAQGPPCLVTHGHTTSAMGYRLSSQRHHPPYNSPRRTIRTAKCGSDHRIPQRGTMET